MCALALNLLSDSTLGSPFTSFRRFDFATALATKLHLLFERVMNSQFSLCQVIKSSPSGVHHFSLFKPFMTGIIILPDCFVVAKTKNKTNKQTPIKNGSN